MSYVRQYVQISYSSEVFTVGRTLFLEHTNITVNKDDETKTPAIYSINTTSQNLRYNSHCLNITGIMMTTNLIRLCQINSEDFVSTGYVRKFREAQFKQIVAKCRDLNAQTNVFSNRLNCS